MSLEIKPNSLTASVLAVTTSTARVALQANPRKIAVINTGTAVAFVNLGDNTVNAAVSNIPVLPGEPVILNASVAGVIATHIAGITGTGSTSLSIVNVAN